MKNISLKRVIKSKEDKVMRSLAFIAIIFSLFLASCSSTYDASAPYDEVYNTGSTPARVTTESVTVRSDAVQSTTTVEGEYYNPEYEAGEFDSEGYYDYEYASRIKRFQDDNPGFDYYNNYYTDNYYYTNDPYYMGSNIYSGCGYCSGVSLSFGWGWGYPYYGYYNPWYWDPWYYPYYGYGWGYGYPGYWGGSYWAGYNDGYWDGYYWGGGGGGYYPEPQPGHAGYYGHRNSRGGSSNGSVGGNNLASGQSPDNGAVKSVNQSDRGFRNDVNSGVVSGNPSSTPGQTGDKTSVLNNSARGYHPDAKTEVPGQTAETPKAVPNATTTTAAGSDRGRGDAGNTVNPTTPAAAKTTVTGNQPTYNKPAEATKTAGQTVKTGETGTTMSPSRRVQPEMKYEKPKTYTSPSYRTTPSNQEYSSPSTRDTRTYSDPDAGTTRKVYSTTPERKTYESGSRSQSEGAPAKINNAPQKYATPNRSSEHNTYSAPSSSGKSSYSAPSRSYSSPSNSGSSRSSGSFGGSSSGGSRSGGGGSYGGSSSGGSSSGGGGSRSGGGGGFSGGRR